MNIRSTNNFTDNYINNLLTARGIKDIPEYVAPTRNYLNPPENLKYIGAGVALYLNVVNKNGHILIITDCDVDGYTSASIIYQYTKRLNDKCQIDYFLHEGKEHGLSDHIDRLMNDNISYDLLILPDSSSNDAKYHDMLDNINLPCLILDHHLTDCTLSDNAIVINNQLSPNYPNKELTGAGVVYQFCRMLDKSTGNNFADDYMDLAAWGIIGDMGSMIDMENRYITYHGLKNIKNIFLKTLLEKQAYSITGKKNATWEDILNKTNPISMAFSIVPLVNAVIRVGTMEEKELLFTAFIDGDKQVPTAKRGAKFNETDRAAVEMTRICINAKTHQNKIKDNAVEQLEYQIFKHDLLENKVLFVRLDSENFPSELNGLIAMQLAAKYKRPTIVARLNNQGYDRGSARGLNQSELKDFREFLIKSGLFEYAQGHANAFGVSILDNRLDAFHKYANKALENIDLGENIYDVDFCFNASDRELTQVIWDVGELHGIWASGNAEPLLYIHDINFTKDDVRIMGANKDTIKIESNGISYIKFKAQDFIDELNTKNGTLRLEIVGRANLNEFNGVITPQILIEDYEIKRSRIIEF